MTIEELKNLMKFNGGGNVTASNIPSNMYAESAYAKYGQNGTAVLPPEARIAGDIQKYTNEVIRQALIAKLEVPANLATAGFKKADYQTLLTTGKVAITTGTTPNTITKTYATTQSELHFARSAVTDKKTCFNAVFAITVPVDIKATWTENTIKTIDPKTGGFDIGTDTILTGANKADEASVSVTGRNMHESPPPPPPATKAPVTPAPAPTPTPAPVVVGTAPVATPAPGPVVAAPAPVATPTPV